MARHRLLESRYKQVTAASISTGKLLEMFGDPKLLNYRDSVSYYEKKLLHNTNANLIAYGKFYGGSTIRLVDTPGGLELTTDGSSNIVSAEHGSYAGYLGDKIYFRNDRDCMSYRYDLASGQTVKLGEMKVGEMVVDPTGVYYINFEDKSTLYNYTFNGIDLKLTNYPVVSFALLGREIIILGENGVLSSYDRKTGKEKSLYQNINAFSFSDGLIVENNGSLVQLPGFGKKAQKLFTGKARLLGANPLYVAYQDQENGVVYCLVRKTLERYPIYNEPVFAVVAYFTTNTVVIYGHNVKNVNLEVSSMAVIEEIPLSGKMQ
jgi:hypothetical protein